MSLDRSLLTKFLHLALALAVVHQLLISLVMGRPESGRPGDALFELHESVGVATLVVLLIFYLWAAVRRRETKIGLLYPWFSGERLRAFWADLKGHLSSLRRGRIPLSDEGPLASAVHGLGLLVATLMAATGASGYFIVSARPLLAVHEAVAPLMWAYLVGHAGLAVIHQVAGYQVFQRMFSFGARAPSRDGASD